MQCQVDHERIEAYALGKLQNSELEVRALPAQSRLKEQP
jgi:hypothetical protein